MISYTVTGVEAVQAELNKIRLDTIQDAVSAILDDMAAEAAQYPAPPPESTYKRTGQLGEKWTNAQTTFVQSSATVLEAVRENSTPYGPYVQGAETQAQVHAGRWKTVESLMADWEARAAERIEEAIGRLVAQ